MASAQHSHHNDRKSSTGSTSFRPVDPVHTESSTTNAGGERRPSAGSGYFSHSHHNGRLNGDHGTSNTMNTSNLVRSPADERERQRPNNGRTYLEASAQSGMTAGNPGRRKHNKDESNGLLSFFRTSSRPPSPDQLESFYSSSHTRKTSFSGSTNGNTGNYRPVVTSAGSFLSNSSSALNGAGYNSTGGGSSSFNNGHHNLTGQSQPHPLDMESDRRRSNDSYSRSSSPDRSSELHPTIGVHKHSFPTTPPPYTRPHQRTDSIKNATDAQHRRTKSTDLGDTYGKRPGQDQEPSAYVASPAKEAKKIILGLFRKKHHHHHGSSSSQHQQPYSQHSHNERLRKCSADDPYMIAPPISGFHAFSMAFFPDHDSILYNGSSEKRPGNDGGDANQKALQYLPGPKKGSKKDLISDPFFQKDISVDFEDMSGIKEDPTHIQRPPISPAVAGVETWLAPESWDVQPATVTAGAQRSLAISPDDLSDMDMSDFENWDYGKTKLSTIRIFRKDTTYTTVNCVFNITASELSTILGKKIFKPDTSKYHLYILRNNIVRALSPHERPLNILRRLLMQFGYTEQDKLEELSGKDNSFICRFTFEEHRAPLTTEADSPDYKDVNLQKRCLPTIPIVLYSKAKDIVRLNVSHNQRMDLPLDFVQNCSVLRELHMAFNDLDRIPSNVRSIVHLQVLDLRGNRIKNLEKANLEEAQELVTLYLQSNRLDSIPDAFHSFEYLRTLSLSNNRFTKVPMVLFQISTLEVLDMSFNELTEIPSEVGRLMKLKELLLFGNRIGPYLPRSMSALTRLWKLDIRQNGILNLDAVNNLPALKELHVDYNTNVIVNNFFKSLKSVSLLKCNMIEINICGTADTLTFLDISFNNLSQLTPTILEHLRSLEVLKLDNNNISSIPETIGTLTRLRVLSISNNQLLKLPEEIGQMDSLVWLDVHNNSLNELPVAIWKCQLSTLNASSNALECFPAPPKLAPPSTNAGLVSALPSSATASDLEGGTTTAPVATVTTTSVAAATSTSPSRTKPLPAPLVPVQNTPTTRAPYAPRLATSLSELFLGDNQFPDEVMYPLSHFMNLKVLNLSHNFIAEIPRGKIPNPGRIVELYLSGNQLTSLPAEDMECLRSLQVLHVNSNKLTTLPGELRNIDGLRVVDVGCNMLKYNVLNWLYDWNWNYNKNLRYLNMSGNKRFEIRRQTAESVPVAAAQPGSLSGFDNLVNLRVLGLMDVTIADNVPENSVDRRVRTSMSTLHNMSYGMADTLGNSDDLCIWDLVRPKFQAKEDESLFGLFDGYINIPQANCFMTSHLKDRFESSLKIELEKLEMTDTVENALRRTFLGLDRELWPVAQYEGDKSGASALVAYIKGMKLYCANIGDTIAVLVKKSDSYKVLSKKHIPWNPTEAFRIRRAGGLVNDKGLLNDELKVSRSFGHFHLVPIVNSDPHIETTTLTVDDDFLIMASSGFWDVIPYTTAVDIAKMAKRNYGDLMYASQKLRDIAISYGAKDHMVVMLIGVGDLFRKRVPSDPSDYHQQNYKRPKAPEGPVDGLYSLNHLKPEIEPPQGHVAMVFTDIKNSTKLWESVPAAMAASIKEHFNVMRRQLRLIGGYEVKNEGDALMASFSSVPAAMLWCFKVQELLIMADWPQEILDSVECRAIYASDSTQLIYRGLSVRMGIHWGQPVSDRDAVTRRMDYYGPMVNRAARICDCADGGEICVSSDVINVIDHLMADTDLEHSDSPQAEHIRDLKKMGFGSKDLGEKKLKGLETPENLHLVYPLMLAGRLDMDASKIMSGAPAVETGLIKSTVDLDLTSVRSLQMICLRLERLASGTTAQHGHATEHSLALLSLPIKDNANQDDLLQITENYIVRIENCFSQLYMAKT
ncbi:cysteinyl-tRNA synthetase, partial [Modicella reniformis]